MESRHKKRRNFLQSSRETHTLGLGYIPLYVEPYVSDPTYRYAVVCDFADGRYGKLRAEEHENDLDKEGNDCSK